MNSAKEISGGLQDTQCDTWVLTNVRGEILEASTSAATLLSVTAVHLRQRSLLLFFTQDRPEWNRLLGVAARGQTLERSAWIRPRDRRPRPVTVELSGSPDESWEPAVLWRFSEATPASQR